MKGKSRSSRKGDTHSEKRNGGVAEDVLLGIDRAGLGDEAEDDSYLFMGATAVRNNDWTLDNISCYND